MRKRLKKSLPVMILWDRRQQRRFVEAVERLCSIVGDLEVLLAAKKRRGDAATRANATRKAGVNGTAAAAELGAAEPAGKGGGA